jgi:hypothetical protein
MEHLNIHAPGLEGREGNPGIFREEKQHTVGKFHPNKKERKESFLERMLRLFRYPQLFGSLVPPSNCMIKWISNLGLKNN